MKPLQSIPAAARNPLDLNQSPNVLTRICRGHGEDLRRMAGTLRFMGAATDDVDLLSRMPQSCLANRIAAERERLDLSAVRPSLRWKLPPSPPAWLTPAVIVKLFDLALEHDINAKTADTELADGRALILPA